MQDEYAWLIEEMGNLRWIMVSDDFFVWTNDANKALRFARQEDAKHALSAILSLVPHLCDGSFPLDVTDHMWCGS
jgi:hypothetical protein